MKRLLRKWLTLLLVNCLLVASLPVMTAFAETAEENNGSSDIESAAEISAEAHLQTNVQDGVILHAFNWSYNAIKEKLPEIAAAGYSTVQTSPVQQPKDYSQSNNVSGQWWKLYRPVSMQIAQQSWLGTKAELTSLCSEADKYGIKIICDIVSNHFGNQSDQAGANSISDQVRTYQPDFYSNRSSYFRNNSLNVDDSSIQKTVQGHVSNCPDLNTNDNNVQQAALTLLKECIDCGVDGFRFDAAKHIETPDDGSYSSQYWPTVANGAKTYYQQKTGKDLFVYGEILNTCGTGRNFSSYTSYINITDNKTGDAVLAAVNNKQADIAADSQYKSGVSADKVVLWAESHSTYEGDSGSGGLSNTSGVSNETIAKAWAIVASRKSATALFLARPGLACMGEAATDGTYRNTAVTEVNKFHNLFTNEDENLGSSGSIAYVQRGGKGIVLANVDGNATSVSIASTGMSDGTYTDMISGETFTVSDGTLTGSIGSTGIAVVYNGKTTPRATSSSESCTFRADTLTLKLSLENAVSGTLCLDDSTPIAFTDGTAIRIGSDYNYGETITLTLTATDQYGTTKTNVYRYKKERNTGSGIYIWLNAAKKTTWKGPFHVWVYDDQTIGKTTTYTNTPEWPGEEMIYDETQKMWYYEVPTTGYLNGQPNNFNLSKSSKAAFIINAISISTNQTVQFPASNSSGVTPHQYLNGKSWEYAVTSGTSITISTRKPTTTDIPAIEITRKYEEPTTQEPTTQEPTTQEPTTQEPTTQEPTTQEPTTQEPTTQEPTTQEPTTQEPTTQEPTTQEPTTQEPTTQEPTTQEPTTQEPTTEEPTTEEPTTQEPTTEEPTAEEPTAEEPTTVSPTTQPIIIVPIEVPTIKPAQSFAEAVKEAINAKSNGSSSNKVITIYWGKAKGAKKYIIYAAYCGAKKYKKIATVKGNITKYVITKLNGKKLNQKKNVKAYVVAYKARKRITRSLKLHVAGYKTKYSNVKKIKIKKNIFTLKKGKTAKIRGKIVLENSSKKAVVHTAKLRFFSNNKKIATVNKKGKITAKEKGSCIIYVYSSNGKAKKVQVKVK